MPAQFGRRFFWASAIVIGLITLVLAVWFIWSATHPTTAIDRSEGFFEFWSGIVMGAVALLGLAVLGTRSVRENCGLAKARSASSE
jgi:uncharacterized membrane-anchored protein